MSSLSLRILIAFLSFIISSSAFLTNTPTGDPDFIRECDIVRHSLSGIYHELTAPREKVLVLLGNKGVGKSTLANLIAYDTLIEREVEETGTIVIESTSERPPFTIKQQDCHDNDNLGIPAMIQVNDIAVWDFPGFSEDALQKLIISSSLKLILAYSENVRIVVVTSESSLQDRGNGLMNSIRDLKDLIDMKKLLEIEKGLSMVVTHLPEGPDETKLKNRINGLKSHITGLSDERENKVKLLDALLNNIFIFRKATTDGQTVDGRLADKIRGLDFIPAESFISNRVDDKTKTICQELCGRCMTNLNQISETLVATLKSPWLVGQGTANPLSNSSIKLPDLKLGEAGYHDATEYTLQIDQLKEIIETLDNVPSKERDLTTSLALIKDLLRTLESYVVDDGSNQAMITTLRTKLQQFAAAAEQETTLAHTFADYTDQQGDLKNLGDKIINLIIAMRQNLEHELRQQVNNFAPDLNRADPPYYQVALGVLEGAEDNSSKQKRMAQCHDQIGQSCAKDKRHADAAKAYIEALKLDPTRDCHKRLGRALTALGLYSAALKLYSTILDTYELKQNCKALLVKDGETADNYASIAQAWLDVSLKGKAKENFLHAYSLAENEAQKSTFLRNAEEVACTPGSLTQKTNQVLSHEELNNMLELIKNLPQ